MEKDHFSIKKVVKIYEVNQRLRLLARVPIAVSSRPSAAHLYKGTLRTIRPSLVFSSRKNSRVETKKIRNIQ